MAEEIKAELGIDASVIEGARGEFSVRVDGKIVAEKSSDDFPSPDACVAAIRAAL